MDRYCLNKVTTILLLVAIFCIISPSMATYRKPPFNGSIFGKRSGIGSNEYDSASKALSAMCEIANEACQSWFPSQEK
ncbi:neuropeptide SIFamide [Sitophilus oryzae]|uniref:Neuropeptide SIFamide n=1 Tax=Sitophilus oryzae TaxID=7048 RepID=A0A6J2XPM3_SITOR|nr:neuropeptide SIFamide [Sitophilus oryzae]